jgi:NDP-sugar pyrophosphorylase family protein
MTATRGVVLAGSYHWGEDTFARRLRGPLLPLAQRPVICYPLAWLRAGGVAEAVVCANSGTPAVRRALGDGARLGIGLSYYADEQPRGPAGCARDAAALAPADTYVLVEGAMIPSVDLAALLAAHRRAGAAVTTVVEIDRRRATADPARRATPGGVYVIERRVLDEVPAAGFQDIKQGLLERLYAAGARVHLHEVQGVSPRVLDHASYAAASGWLVSTAARRPEFRDYLPLGEGLRHPSAEVDERARVFGPVLVGPHARVGADAILIGPATVGAHSVVEAAAIVTRSHLWERCRVGAGAVVDASLLAHGVVVAPGRRLMGAVEVAAGAAPPADALAALADVVAPAPGPCADAPPVRVPDDFALPSLRLVPRADAGWRRVAP